MHDFAFLFKVDLKIQNIFRLTENLQKNNSSGFPYIPCALLLRSYISIFITLMTQYRYIIMD